MVPYTHSMRRTDIRTCSCTMVVCHQHPSLQQQPPRSRHNLGYRCLVKRQDSLPFLIPHAVSWTPKLQPPPPLGSPLAWFTPPLGPVPTLEKQPPDLCQFTCLALDATETPASTKNSLLGRGVCCCVSDTRTLDHNIAILGGHYSFYFAQAHPPLFVSRASTFQSRPFVDSVNRRRWAFAFCFETTSKLLPAMEV
ncbi:uncharacterized protein LY79DRAFT_546624 [Colletotrichum navitas]|uniref:Uncharacterized protein n=1 Tax=Colletotrichum navitas TaxID=681940 RepID=A0AAD8Q6E6_9PEZI|nr:uncharacterized protein LY79DRAFT_546624 [Colletotrichum navitas]KAK1595514.1 hypothetical protein LY79DRAFT_546624 [Colletotrichum navitas]